MIQRDVGNGTGPDLVAGTADSPSRDTIEINHVIGGDFTHLCFGHGGVGVIARQHGGDVRHHLPAVAIRDRPAEIVAALRQAAPTLVRHRIAKDHFSVRIPLYTALEPCDQISDVACYRRRRGRCRVRRVEAHPFLL